MLLNKILIIVAIGLLGASAFFSFKNRGELISLRQEKSQNNAKVKSTIDKMVVVKGNVETEATGISSAKGSRDEAKIGQEKAQRDQTSRQKELGEVTEQVTAAEGEAKKQEDAIAQALQKAGGTLDEISAKMEQLTKDVETKTKEKETLEGELGVAKGAVAKNDESVKVLNTQAADRKKALALNSTEGTVVASNPDFGFAVVNLGSNKGLTPDSKLIVMRGSERIGTLTVTSIEPTRSVADVVQDSLKGDQVAPGDSVIVEKVSK